MLMSTSTLPKPGLIAAAAAIAAMVAVSLPLALAAPTAVPPADSQGYLNSTARCISPDTAVVFGTTETSRVAICKTTGGEFEYRGVRVRDGARLIVTASRTSDGAYVASNDGVTYTVTATTLSVSADGDTVRTESWTDFNNPQSPASSTPPAATTKPTTAGSATPSNAATESAPNTTAAPSTANVPLPPPLPAEVGGNDP
jgi:hypothetical protein